MKNSIQNSQISDSHWLLGPDKVCPTECVYSCTLNEPVRLKASQDELKKDPPVSIFTFFKRTVEANPDYPALAFKLKAGDKKFTKVSYLNYWKTCLKASKSFIKV
jgi:hypothetical protein